MRSRTVNRTALGVATCLALVSCGTDSLLGPDAPQGIEGLVVIGPQCPVQSVDDPCPDLPYEASIEVLTDTEDFVTRVRSGPDGTFRLGLRPGAYLLRAEPGDPFPHATDVEAFVIPGSYTDVLINYDTGIR